MDHARTSRGWPLALIRCYASRTMYTTLPMIPRKHRRKAAGRGRTPASGAAQSAATSQLNRVIAPRINIKSFSPDNVYRLRRNLADALVALPSGTSPTVQFMPGFTGTPWLILGSPLTELSPNSSTYLAQPFACSFTLDAFPSYNDIFQMFSEFRVMGVKFTVKTLNGASGLMNIGGVVPEVWMSAWPEDQTPPGTVATQEQRVNIKRCLTGNASLNMTVAPRPAIQLFQSPLASAYGYMPNVDFWASTQDANKMPWYATTGVIRNFFAQAGSGFNVRFEAEAFIEVRRPR